MRSALGFHLWFALSLTGLLVAGCNAQSFLASPTPTATQVRITATLAPTFTNTHEPDTPTPTPTDTPIPTDTPMPTDTPPPTYTALPTYTPLPSVTPTPRIPPRPADFLDYPDTIRRIADTVGGDPQELWSALAQWGAIRDGQGTVKQVDMTLDGKSDLVVWYMNPRANLPLVQGDILILTPNGSNWRNVFDANFGASASTVGLGVQLLAAEDLNNDRQAELAWTWADCGAHTCFTTVEIGSWTGTGFSDLTAGDIVFPTLQSAEFVDQNGDGTRELLLTGGIISSVGAGPQRVRTEIYRWNGSGWALTDTLYAATDWLPLVVWEANDRLAAGDLAEAIDLYSQVITNGSFKPWHSESAGAAMTAEEERALLTGFSRWRLVLAHTALGKTDEAETWLARLRETQPDSPYRQVAERFWQTWQSIRDLKQACDAANSYASSNRTTVVEPLNNFGYANPQFEANDICVLPSR
ncbi:MAG: tetratricopeptide repeat protein [Ardenticatenaceae bacterium]|nr:tetratricopeptide repeat protein [Ardenticatenaceae bacterium]HBY98609.1 hypothetical protein [Chloroflexota bacterium]